MVVTVLGQIPTHTGHEITVMEDDEGAAGWICRGCLTIGEPPYITTALDSAHAHATTCRTPAPTD
jgi:hypothetical protein